MKYYFLIFILALLPRLLLFHTPYWTTPDALEYLSVTKNLAEGKGFTSTVKIHHFDDKPVIRPALGTKPPLFSLYLYPFYKISSDPYFLQLVVLATGALAVAVFFRLASILFSRRFALLAAALFTLNPDFLINNRLLLVEPLFLCLTFSCLILLFKRKSLFFVALFAVLAYLTRIEGLLLFPVITFYLWFDRGLKSIFGFIFLSLLCLSPYFYLNFKINGSALANVGNYHFITLDFMHSMYYGYGEKVLTPLAFIRSHYSSVVHKSLSILSQLVIGILKPGNLGLLFLIPWWASLKKIKTFSLFLFIPLNLILICLTFGLVLDAPRYLVFIDALVILLAVNYYSRNSSKLSSFLVFSVMFIYLVFDFHRLAWAGHQTDPNWTGQNLAKVSSAIESFPRNSLVASDNPGLVNIKTGHPAVVLPKNLNPDLFNTFVSQYRPRLILTTDLTSMTYRTLTESGLLQLTFNQYHLFIVEPEH